MKHYAELGWKVTAVNRRQDADLEKRFPGVRFHHFDVRNREQVQNYFKDAAGANDLPSHYFLSAGINKVDNLETFSLDIYSEVMETNLTGVLNFVDAALPRLAGQGATFVAASSTTNIFPNPNCLGYYLSKLNLYRSFKILNGVYGKKGFTFKSLVLGPIATNIFASGKLPSKLQSVVLGIIMVNVEDSVPKIARFIHSRCKVFYYPKLSCLLFLCLRIANTLLPGLYKGSAPPKET